MPQYFFIRLIALTSLFATTCLLTGCLHFSKREQTQYLIAPPSVDLTVQKGIDSGYLVAGDWPRQDWWTLFTSPQLNALMLEALDNNPSIQAIHQKLKAAHQIALIARSKLFPWISLDGSYDDEYLSKNGLLRALNPRLPLHALLYDLKFNLNYELDIWGKNKELYKAALGDELSECAEQAQTILWVTTSVAQTFVAVKEYQQQKNLIAQLIAVLKEINELQDFLYEKALANKLITLAAEENYFDAEKLLWVVDQQLQISKHQLNVLVGRGPDDPLDLGEESPPPIRSLCIPCDITSDLLARRPDLMAKIWSAKALAHQVNAAITEYYPDVNLTAFLGLESVKGSLFFNLSSFTTGYRPAFHLPIFTAGAIKANVNTHIALFNETIFEYNQLLLTSAQEVTDNLEIAQSLFRQIADQQNLLKRLKERVELTDLLYQKALGDQLSNYYIKEEFIRQEIEELALTYDLYTALIQLIRSLGGGYQSLDVPLRAQEPCL
jgi:NodT family efflux transporter outer membrane factor (OMF) lipoprotein